MGLPFVVLVLRVARFVTFYSLIVAGVLTQPTEFLLVFALALPTQFFTSPYPTSASASHVFVLHLVHI
jgi:hypothetical protein